MSNGRAEIGIGAGWLREEWTAAGLDPRSRGRRLDEALAVCRRLWSEDVVEHLADGTRVVVWSIDDAADEPWDGFNSDAEADGDALASAGWGTDEDYGGCNDW